VEAVRSGRRKEFESFGWGDDVPDPQSEETFRRSMLDRARASRPEHAAVYQLYRDLLALRDEEPVLRPDGSALGVFESDGCITMLRRDAGRGTRGARRTELLAVFNCTGQSREVRLPDAAGDRWVLRLTTDAASYGGEGRFSDDSSDAISVGAGREAWSATDAGASAEPNASGMSERDDAPRRLLETDAQRHSVTMPPWTAAVFTSST
jgi:Alpha amylase, C-terminal all-beta domain